TTSGNFQFRSHFPAEKSSIDQTRGCEHALIIGGSKRGALWRTVSPWTPRMEIPIKTIHPFLSAALPFSEVDSSRFIHRQQNQRISTFDSGRTRSTYLEG